jgi:hypothetical protein
VTGLPRCSVATAHAEDPVFTEPRYAYVGGGVPAIGWIR